jgi:hypothetical protein
MGQCFKDFSLQWFNPRLGRDLGSVIIDSQPLAVALLILLVIWGSNWHLGSWIGLGFGILGISLIGLPQDSGLKVYFTDWLSFPNI